MWPFPDLTPTNLNPVGFYTHAPTSAVYLLNSGDSVGGYSSLQRVGKNGILGPELRLPANARIGSAFELGPKHFALLQMTGDHVFVVDAEHDRLESIYRFDGTRFRSVPIGGAVIPDRSQSILHDILPDPSAPGRFHLVDSKGKQLIHARYDESGGFETLDTNSLLGGALPSWGLWLGE